MRAMNSRTIPIRPRPLGMVLFLCCLPVFICMPADNPEWKAGLASVKITPDKPLRMSGYAARTDPFKKVEQDLYAKALVVEDREGQRAVLVTTDLIGIKAEMADAICKKVEEEYGLKRHEVLLSASHTHSAPSLNLHTTQGSNESNQDAAQTAAYTKNLIDEVTQLIGKALGQLEPAHLAWGTGVAHFAMNRREFTQNGVVLGVNTRGLVDRSVPVLRIDSKEGSPRALLFSYACHNTTLTGDNHSLCGDYAGFAQEHIEAKLPNVQAMFMAGCGGDANPYPRGTMKWARRHGEALGQEVCRIAAMDLRTIKGPLELAYEHVKLPLQSHSRKELEQMAKNGSALHRRTAREILAKMDRAEEVPDSYDAPIALWQFGQDLTLVALPSEVVVEYVWHLEKALGPLQLWIAAYCNDYFGYLPTPRILEEGGYETRGLFSGDGWFAPETTAILVEKTRELAQQAGRPIP